MGGQKSERQDVTHVAIPLLGAVLAAGAGALYAPPGVTWDIGGGDPLPGSVAYAVAFVLGYVALLCLAWTAARWARRSKGEP